MVTIAHVDLVYKQFGQKLREVRTERQFSQTYVADHVGLSRTSISNIEHGRQRIPLHLVYLLAEAVRADPLSLMPPGAVLEGVIPTRDLSRFEDPNQEWVSRVVGDKKPATRGGRYG